MFNYGFRDSESMKNYLTVKWVMCRISVSIQMYDNPATLAPNSLFPNSSKSAYTYFSEHKSSWPYDTHPCHNNPLLSLCWRESRVEHTAMKQNVIFISCLSQDDTSDPPRYVSFISSKGKAVTQPLIQTLKTIHQQSSSIRLRHVITGAVTMRSLA